MKILNISDKARLWIVASPSGGGKTSLVEAMVSQTNKTIRSISFTTRQQRDGELNGVDYNFVTKAEFELLVDNNEMLEYELVFGNYYGTSLDFINKYLEQGIDVILTIDWQGSQQVRQKVKRTRSIFIIPPTIESLVKRLNKRGQDSKKIVESRMEQAKEQISHYSEFDYLIVNDSFELALAEMKAIILGDRLQIKRQQLLHQKLLTNLLK